MPAAGVRGIPILVGTAGAAARNILEQRNYILTASSPAGAESYPEHVAENLAFIPNAIHGVNIIARSLALEEGDDILTSDHEYGAMNYTCEFIGKKTGAKIVRQPIPLPVHY